MIYKRLIVSQSKKSKSNVYRRTVHKSTNKGSSGKRLCGIWTTFAVKKTQTHTFNHLWPNNYSYNFT